ncbi:transcriptional regulator with XRE-family HTH domain [Actinoalloteichus hymeniacidonis]|nr:transcriptional regulator with XRE-family HTH domain [Actinoalloteichus hymeniacidonis]
MAEISGVSIDLIRKLEQGTRQTASIVSLQRIARALDVDIADLLGRRAGPLSNDPAAGVVAIRRALTTVDDLLGTTSEHEEPFCPTEARRAVEYGWAAYWRGRYALLVGILPQLIRRLRAALHVESDDRSRAHELLGRCLWLTGCTLVHLGYADPAWLAIRQAITAADAGSDELLAAVLRGSAAWQLLVQGRYAEAHRLATHAAASIEPAAGSSPERLSNHGSLLLTAATAAARNTDSVEARHLLAQAATIAVHTGDRSDYETYFGPAQVVMQTVDIAVVGEDYSGALTTATTMPVDARLPLASRARHLADQAFAHARLGHRERALQNLLTAERIAPDWMEYQTLPRRVISELLSVERSTPVRDLAQRLGVFE